MNFRILKLHKNVCLTIHTCSFCTYVHCIMKVTYKFSKTNVLCTYVATSKNLDKTGTLINPQPTFQK